MMFQIDYHKFQMECSTMQTFFEKIYQKINIVNEHQIKIITNIYLPGKLVRDVYTWKGNMALSKPIYNLLGIYFQNLHYNPVRTRAITSCLSHVLGNLVSQYLSGKRPFNEESLMAFGLFGLFLGGPINYLLEWGLDAVFTSDSAFFYLKQFLAERLLFTPIYTAFSIYFIYRLQGETNGEAFLKILYRRYILRVNWKWLTLIQFINYKMIPPMFRDLVAFTVSFFWCIYLSRKLSSSKKKGPEK